MMTFVGHSKKNCYSITNLHKVIAYTRQTQVSVYLRSTSKSANYKK